MVNKSEREAMEKFKAEGWEVYRNGWPDFLLVKKKEGVIEVKAVEIKSVGNKPSEAQVKMFGVLESIGMPVSIVEVGQFEYILRRVVNRVFDRLVDDAGDDSEKISRINVSRSKVLDVASTNPAPQDREQINVLGDMLYTTLKEKLLV